MPVGPCAECERRGRRASCSPLCLGAPTGVDCDTRCNARTCKCAPTKDYMLPRLSEPSEPEYVAAERRGMQLDSQLSLGIEV